MSRAQINRRRLLSGVAGITASTVLAPSSATDPEANLRALALRFAEIPQDLLMQFITVAISARPTHPLHQQISAKLRAGQTIDEIYEQHFSIGGAA